MKCPECGGELSKKWQQQTCSNQTTVFGAMWCCSICGGAYTKTQLLRAQTPAGDSAARPA